MSREFSRSRTRSPVDGDDQKILNLDSSPGSSRKHGEDGEDEGVHIPSFSKEVSLDSEEDVLNKTETDRIAESPSSSRLEIVNPVESSKNISPKGILKRRVPEQQFIGFTETREKTKCCHPLVNKIKHLADKTLHKIEHKLEGEKSPLSKRKKNDTTQEIRTLKTSPGAVRRQKFGAIKLGDSDEMSKTEATPPTRNKKEHIYEDIEDGKNEKTLQFVSNLEDSKSNRDSASFKEDYLSEKKSLASQDPSLVNEDNIELKPEEHVMEKLHSKDDNHKEATLLEDLYDDDEPNVDEIFQNQFDNLEKDESPRITITEIIDDDTVLVEETTAIIIESSPSPCEGFKRKVNVDPQEDWSKTNIDHEYEIIEKPPSNLNFTTITAADETMKAEDEKSSTTSLERKFLRHMDDEDDQENKENVEEIDEASVAEALQKDIEDRYFVNTPSTVSRTECEVSTSQVDSSALENLPLKRGSRSKNKEKSEGLDVKIQQRLREGTGKLKTQASKLKTKLQNIKTKQFSMPERPKLNFPDRSKFKMPERPKFTLPDRRKFSLPDRPKFKKINISEKLSLGDRKKFSMPERPKFNMPEMPKFKLPDRPIINFSSLSRKKEYKLNDVTGSGTHLEKITTIEYETKTYPRLFGRKKKTDPLTTSSPSLNREATPPPMFTFSRVKKTNKKKVDDFIDSNEQPREYGIEPNLEYLPTKHFDRTYDFDKVCNDERLENESEIVAEFQYDRKTASTSDISPTKQEYNHVINEINNDEFFVRPRGISRENIQVREYLSDEIRQAFKIPKNALAMMDNTFGENDDLSYKNDEADPELMLEENEPRYLNEDINDADDGYYTFPPVRPYRAKRKKKEQETVAQIENESVQYMDDNMDNEIQISDEELDSQEHFNQTHEQYTPQSPVAINRSEPESIKPTLNEYENEEVENINIPQIQSQTLPLPPKRKRKSLQKTLKHSSLTDFQNIPTNQDWPALMEPEEDIIVYRTEHEYVVPSSGVILTEHSPVVPRRNRNRSRSSHGTSLCDDDRTSQGADSLTLDTHMTHIEESYQPWLSRQESPGYATVDKGQNVANKPARRSKSKTPPIRSRKSHSSERKYYTVGSTKSLPNRPPRKKSSTSLMTLGSIAKRSLSGDTTQYVEIEDLKRTDDSHKDLVSGEVLNKMKDRPLPPPPRPPRGSKNKHKTQPQNHSNDSIKSLETKMLSNEEIIEIEVSTQTDPLPDDVDFELGMEENINCSMSSSLKDIDEQSTHKSISKLIDSTSRPTSRSEKSFKISDPKISELTKANIGRTSPTVILVERRVSSPTRIKDREEMLTEASLTVQHIDVDDSQIPEVPPLPTSKGSSKTPKFKPTHTTDEQALEKLTEVNREVQLDNLITQRLQVSDLDVGRLNVSELQASKILVSDIEGMTLQVTELDSKSGHISVSGIEFSQSVIDEIVKKFSELSSSNPAPTAQQTPIEILRPVSREEETQTDDGTADTEKSSNYHLEKTAIHTSPQPHVLDDTSPPQRPPPPDLTPLLYSYLQDIATPAASLYNVRGPRERPFTEFHESQHHSPPPPTRRSKRKPTTPQTESSSDDDKPRPSPRRMPVPARVNEPSIVEAGAQFLRVCQNSVSRTLKSIFHSFITYISGTEDKRDVQMALVIFLVLIAGLIMFGLSDSRTIHHHHWEFFNPPDGKPT